MCPDFYRSQIVDPDFFTYPGIIADFKFPGILDVYIRFDDYPFAYRSPEKPEKKHLDT
jgi:hypothetical protein